MTRLRIRVLRRTPDCGEIDWARLDERSRVLDSGTANLPDSRLSGDCDVVLAPDLVLLDRVAASAAQKRRISASLRYLVEESAITDPAQLHVVAAPAPASGDVLPVCVIDQPWLKRALGALTSAGLAPQRVVPETLLPELPPHGWVVVLAGGGGFARTGPYEGFALDDCAAGQVPAALRLALARARTAGIAPRSIEVRAAPGAALPELRFWSEALDIPAQAGPPWLWSAAALPDLDLLPEAAQQPPARELWRTALRRPALLALMLVVLNSVAIGIDWAIKARERASLATQMRALYRETFGERAVIVDPALQMRIALQDLRRRAGLPESGEFLELLPRLAERMLEPGQQRIEAIGYEEGELTLSLRAMQPAESGALLSALRAKTPPPGMNVAIEAGPAGHLVRLVARAKDRRP